MSTRARVLLLALVAGSTVPAGAQSAGAAAEPQVEPSTVHATAAASLSNAPTAVGPRVDNARAGVREAAPAPLPSPTPRPADTGRNRALMIVGGAALIVGAVVGDKPGGIIMVGGALVGLYGLYKFLE